LNFDKYILNTILQYSFAKIIVDIVFLYSFGPVTPKLHIGFCAALDKNGTPIKPLTFQEYSCNRPCIGGNCKWQKHGSISMNFFKGNFPFMTFFTIHSDHRISAAPLVNPNFSAFSIALSS
jgi:hypothetical protein